MRPAGNSCTPVCGRWWQIPKTVVALAASYLPARRAVAVDGAILPGGVAVAAHHGGVNYRPMRSCSAKLLHHVGIDHRRLDIRVSEVFLDLPDSPAGSTSSKIGDRQGRVVPRNMHYKGVL